MAQNTLLYEKDKIQYTANTSNLVLNQLLKV